MNEQWDEKLISKLRNMTVYTQYVKEYKKANFAKQKRRSRKYTQGISIIM